MCYHSVAAFQDGIVAQGINGAAADGCFYFSAAGNGGNLNDGTSGVWEGDYAAGSPLVLEGESVGVRHDFGGGVEENRVTEPATRGSSCSGPTRWERPRTTTTCSWWTRGAR